MSNEQIDNIKNSWINKANAIGYTAAATLLSALYPVDFECYMIAFELCNSSGETLDYFTFPIMPTDLSIDEEIPVKVENTFGGVNSISSNVFVPKNISLHGNFGRQFRVLVRNKTTFPLYDKIVFGKTTDQIIQERDYGVKGIKKKEPEISNSLKTGFGSFKVLQSIINRAVEVDDKGECNKLYMYNMAYGENYLVKPINFRGSQSVSKNGIWNYELNLKAVCPLHLEAHKQGSILKAYTMSAIQSALNIVLSGIRQTFNINN